MDYNLKKENRKKFQDKTKLKRHHKKDYRKVVRNDEPMGEKEPERVREYDIEGNPILYDDEELDLEGNIVPKGSTNDFRYKEQIVDLDNIESLKDKFDVDFNKIIRDDELSHKVKDPKKMNTKELLELKIIDQKFTQKEPVEVPQQQEHPAYIPQTSAKVKLSSNIPPKLRNDEEFLDNLI